jgi:hypothetical protein
MRIFSWRGNNNLAEADFQNFHYGLVTRASRKELRFNFSYGYTNCLPSRWIRIERINEG